MRYRIWAVLAMAVLAIGLSSCTASRTARGPVTTPVPTKTLRPTFTHTPAKPTMTAAPTEVPATATSEAPAATPEPPTEVPSPTAEVSKLTANSSVNVRSGPGTNYPQVGRLQAGESYVITGKNPTGDWWQFDFNGQSGWVLGELVRTNGGERVQVAANIVPPPTARPRPTARPASKTAATATAATAATTACRRPISSLSAAPTFRTPMTTPPCACRATIISARPSGPERPSSPGHRPCLGAGRSRFGTALGRRKHGYEDRCSMCTKTNVQGRSCGLSWQGTYHRNPGGRRRQSGLRTDQFHAQRNYT